MDQLLEGLGYTDPRWVEVECKGCGAVAGDLCQSKSGRPCAPHSSRYRSTILPESPAEMVVIGATTKYHRQGCPVGPYSWNQSDPISRSSCEQLGMKPCMICKPHMELMRLKPLDPAFRKGEFWGTACQVCCHPTCDCPCECEPTP